MSAKSIGVRLFLIALLLTAMAASLAAFMAWQWTNKPLTLAQPQVELSVEPGSGPREVAQRWVQAGVQTSPEMLYQWFRLSGDARRIRAGTYEVETGVTPRGLLAKMVQGDEAMDSVRLLEGWTFRQFREELAKTPNLKQTSAAMTEAEVMAAIGAPGTSAEGRFYPDTYRFSRGVSDLAVLRSAYAAMRKRLETAWEQRAQALVLKNTEEVLTLASIVEKETGRSSDRGRIAGVFLNRLRIGMPLQTDPTVIYGLGESFDGNLRKRDLQADTPYNTYTRRGLPPTPISMPSMASINAVLHPEETKALYFVARGDGTSAFSENLADHNRAVNQFQRGGRP
jgi:UPF0755 protein